MALKVKPKFFSLFITLVLLLSVCHSISVQAIDTIYADKALTKEALIRPLHNKYIMLVSKNHIANSIKYLDRRIFNDKGNIVVVQKLMNGSYVNIDSVIVSSKTLAPIESYSDINTSRDSFVYVNGRVSGRMLLREGNKKGSKTNVDVTFDKPMFNGLIYAETFQAMSYVKDHPFVIAEYVPGHQTKFSKVEYVINEDLNLANKPIHTKVIKVQSYSGDLYYWLDAEDQELLKIEAKFPTFDYCLIRTL